jgi:hypothetical protein
MTEASQISEGRERFFEERSAARTEEHRARYHSLRYETTKVRSPAEGENSAVHDSPSADSSPRRLGSAA